jgi:hypothetical protein
MRQVTHDNSYIGLANLQFSALNITGSTCAVADVWAGTKLPSASGSVSATIAGHASALYALTACA